MKEKVLQKFEAWANWKGILLFFILEAALNVLLLHAMRSQTGLAAQTPVFDLKLWYTPQEITRALMLYTPAQRWMAALEHLTLDTVYPLVYGTLFSLLLIILYRHRLPEPQRHRLLILPWLGVLADYLENITLAALFLTYPARLPVLASLAPVCTAAKWGLLLGSLAMVLWGLLMIVIAKEVLP
jgi:hypothetical protein